VKYGYHGLTGPVLILCEIWISWFNGSSVNIMWNTDIMV